MKGTFIQKVPRKTLNKFSNCLLVCSASIIFTIVVSTLIIGSLAKPFEGRWNCYEPECRADFLFPHYNPEKFWQCVESEDGWVAEELTCPQALHFSPANQGCLLPEDVEEVVCELVNQIK